MNKRDAIENKFKSMVDDDQSDEKLILFAARWENRMNLLGREHTLRTTDMHLYCKLLKA
jgi:hypothetical protein